MEDFLIKLVLRTGVTEQEIKNNISDIKDSDLLLKLARGQKITDADIATELYEVCYSVHASCDNSCPVYSLNGGVQPGCEKPFKANRGCDCFKNGTAMMNFIRKKSKK